ncbi:MAG: NUDIX hydrolase [Candidatus Nanopelagicales bacterium]|nr:NUDIX hydrolase [Candidatus Nanopelagicales bacterium]MDD2819051.1 NUDIX hydrolase [Candidatus Nanopelagicales bacterium]
MAPDQGSTPVRAAGVILLRGTQGRYETLVVHRPHRSDWSLPKGKIDPGEHVINAAIRECDEETGIQAILGSRLPTQEYIALGRAKTVEYWVAQARNEEEFVPNDEVDELRWIPAQQAKSLLTYEHDIALVEQAATLPQTVPLIILRHTQAVKRSDFKGKHDYERPISGKGRSQSKGLMPLLDAYGITAVHSSDSERCMQSVKRYAKSINVPVIPEPALSEERFLDNPKKVENRMLDLLSQHQAMVVCSHRPVMPTILSALAQATGGDASRPQWDPKLQPGSFIVLHRAFAPDGTPRIVSMERHQLED